MDTSKLNITETFRLVRRGEKSGTNLYTAYRPLRFSELYGPAKKTADGLKKQLLLNDGKLAHAAMAFTGTTGTGKTTLALIMALALNCSDLQPDEDGEFIEPCLKCPKCKGILNRSLDGRDPYYIVKNAAKMKNDDIISMVENDIYGGTSLLVSKYGTRVICLEEAHNLTKKGIENLLLPVENVLNNPRRQRVHLFLTSSDHDTLFSNKAWKSRILSYKFSPWTFEDLYTILVDINKNEHTENNRPKLDKAVFIKIIEQSDMLLRGAIALLQAVLEQTIPNDKGIITLEEVGPVLNIYNEEEELFEDFIESMIKGKEKICFKILRDRYYKRPAISNEEISKRILKGLTGRGLFALENDWKNGRKLIKMAMAFSNSMKTSDYQDRYSAIVLATAAAFDSGGNNE